MTLKPLKIDPNRFMEAYNIPIADNISQKNGLDYLNYSTAVLLFRQYFPELDFACETNSSGSIIFKEDDDRGYFIKPYIFNEDGQQSAPLYFCVLNNSNRPVLPSSTDKYGNPELTSQLINKAYWRAVTKAIAITTGIGLKLWTRQDLDEDEIGPKMELIQLVKKLHNDLINQGGTYELPELTMQTDIDTIKNVGKVLRSKLTKES